MRRHTLRVGEQHGCGTVLQCRGGKPMPIKVLPLQGYEQLVGAHGARICTHTTYLPLRLTPEEGAVCTLQNLCDAPRWHNRSPSLRECSLGHFAVVEMPARLAQNLIVFVALASNDDGVLGLGHRNGVFDGLLT